ncbi:CAP-Gly domain-containing linker protein 4 [Haplosporangium sp. Z 767]|nr:CAP-Gly domain-containing linker protein 4 [Haplosporangium sp. Z 767]
MALRTPQVTASKAPKSASPGGPATHTSIPTPPSVLQRRSLVPPSSGKPIQNMSAEQQQLLAEAISIHSPGLVDSNRRRTDSIGSGSESGTPGTGMGTGTGSFSPGSISNRTDSPTATAVSSPSYRSPQSRRQSTGVSSEINAFGQTSNIRAANTAYSAISPLTTSSLQQSFRNSSSPSPTAMEPPSLSRQSRLSSGPGSSAMTSPLTGASRLMKQPQSQRSSITGLSSSTLLGPSAARNNVNSHHETNTSPLPDQSQSQLPPSLEGIELGDRVVVESMGLSGYLRFVGPTKFKAGIWAGIELDTPTGKNDGSVGGVDYFTCRPKCGIFVLASKMVKAELLIPFTPAHDATATEAQLSSTQEGTRTTPSPPPVDHAAQVASRITAGSRASRYIGVTASQLKQRQAIPSPANSRLSAQQHQLQQPQNLIGDNRNGSPTATRTLPASSTGPPTTSPTPAGTTTRVGLGSRLSQPGSKTSLLSLANKTGSSSRPAPTATSPPASVSSRPRTSPTPGRQITSARRLSSRASDISDTQVNNISNSNSSIMSPNLLDQATLIQMAESPQGDLAVQLQQLQLDFGVAIAENNMLKTEMNQTKSQLEMTRLLEKRDLSYDERVFLSKSLGRGGIDERLSQELEDLHLMKAEWEKEKTVKDQEIKAITEKMTEAWLEAARTQKERTALVQEKEELESKLCELQESVGDSLGSGSTPVNEEQLALIDSLKEDLQTAEQTIAALEATLQDLNARLDEEEDRLRTTEETLTETRVHYAEQLTLLEQDRDDLQSRLDDLELVLKVTTEALQSKLEAALRDASHSEEQLHEVQARLEHEAEIRRTKDTDSENQLKQTEAELQGSQSLLAKSEKLAKSLEDKVKEYEMSLTKREQEIADLKLELQDLAGMAQSVEVDQMRKVWEHEKKRLEETVEDDKAVIASLRNDIEALKSNEAELVVKITGLESTVATMNESKAELESEVSRLHDLSTEAEEMFSKERLDLQVRVIESEEAMEAYVAETKDKIEALEAIALTAETWKEQYEATQLEMIQNTAKAQNFELELAEAQAQRDAAIKDLEDKVAQLSTEHQATVERIQTEQKTTADEKSKLEDKVSELEAALALSASTQAKAASVTDADVTEPPSKRTEWEEEIAHLKQMVHDLTRENVTVANVNKKLMQEHDNLMEAHKHVETECLKLMDEVERLHSESLATGSMDEESEATEEKDELDMMENTEPRAAAVKETATENRGPTAQSQSVIRLENLLKEKQALLDRLTQAHAAEMRDLRQRYVDLDRSKSYEVGQLNKELTELESLIESKIFHEADLEEEVQRKQKLIDRLQNEVADLRSQLLQTANGTNRSVYLNASRSSLSINSQHSEYRPTSAATSRMSLPETRLGMDKAGQDSQVPFCEICEVEGHDIITCSAAFGTSKSANMVPLSRSSLNTTPVPTEIEDGRPYCENCDEFGQHYTDECPNESLTY